MNNADLVDQIQFVENENRKINVKIQINTLLNKLSNDQKLQVFRGLILEQIYSVIDKFPQQTQKEMLAIMTDKYLSEWAQ